MLARETLTYRSFYSSHVFGGLSRSLRGPNLGMVIRGLVSSPLLHAAAAGRLSLSHCFPPSLHHGRPAPYLSALRTSGSTLRAGNGMVSFRPGPGIAELLLLNSDRAYILTTISRKRQKAGEARLVCFTGKVCLTYRHKERFISVFFAWPRTPAGINLSPLFNAQFMINQ